MTTNIDRYQKRIDFCFGLTNQLPPISFELRSHWAKYLCVLVSGYLEVVVEELYGGYAEKKANPLVRNFVTKTLEEHRKGRNMKIEVIAQIAGKFSVDWGNELRNLDEQYRDAVDTIVNNRNWIAHGRESQITVHDVQDYFKKIGKVVEVIERQCQS